MSYKSLTNSRQSRRDRKVSASSLQTFTCDSEKQITPSPYSQKAYKQVTPSEYSGRWRDQQEIEQNIVSINIYNENFEINCNDGQSIAQFMNHLNQIASINIKTKISLILMISQRAYQVNKEHSIILKRTLQEY